VPTRSSDTGDFGALAAVGLAIAAATRRRKANVAR
jgi:MYXO-CTERM domain-containing protein